MSLITIKTMNFSRTGLKGIIQNKNKNGGSEPWAYLQWHPPYYTSVINIYYPLMFSIFICGLTTTHREITWIDIMQTRFIVSREGIPVQLAHDGLRISVDLWLGKLSNLWLTDLAESVISSCGCWTKEPSSLLCCYFFPVKAWIVCEELY